MTDFVSFHEVVFLVPESCTRVRQIDFHLKDIDLKAGFNTDISSTYVNLVVPSLTLFADDIPDLKPYLSPILKDKHIVDEEDFEIIENKILHITREKGLIVDMESLRVLLAESEREKRIIGYTMILPLNNPLLTIELLRSLKSCQI